MSKSLLAILAGVFLTACGSLAPVKLPANFPAQVFSDQTLSNAGRKVGVQALSNNLDIWVTNLDGSTTPISLTDSLANDYSPAWSPDGLKVAFVSERDNNPEIYVMNADGTAQTRLISNSATDILPAWSPDGQYIAFASNRDNNFEIYIMKNDGSEQRRVTNNTAYDIYPTWSFDGQRLAYISAPTETAEGNIYVIKPDGTGQISYIDFAIPDKSVLKFDPNGKKKNCSAFKTQVEAQIFFIAAGGPLRDPHGLESGGVIGLACESLP